MGLLRFLGLGGASSSSSSDTNTVRSIVKSLDALEPERARYIAAFAYMLCRVARTDLSISDHEAEEMERLVVERGGLTPDQAVLVLQIAKSQESMFGGTESFLVAREFNKISTREQKLGLLDCLYAVSAADQSISTLEDNEIVRICAELQLPREEVVAARGRFREYLAVLKGMPTP
jgi:uncharacterized tellurite resistance protein B-like protein